MSGIFVPIAFFAMIAAIVIVPGWLKSQERTRLHETLKASIDKGQPIPPEVIEAITNDVKIKRPPSPERDLRVGIIWLGVGIGFAALGLALGFDEPDATYPLLGVGAFPGFIGLAFILISFLGRARKQ
jgi:hypothetical protein